MSGFDPVQASAAQQFPFKAQVVGSHWSRKVQEDEVAVSWAEKAIWLGECKWGTERVAREVLTELIEEKTPKVLKILPEAGAKWTVHHGLFSRAGFTPATQILAEETNVTLVDLDPGRRAR